jgi:hypothetical protein
MSSLTYVNVDIRCVAMMDSEPGNVNALVA